MNPSEHHSPAPPPDPDFCRLVEGALHDGDLFLTERRRVAVLKAFADAVPAETFQNRRVIHFAWWFAAGAAACVALWLSGIFEAPTGPRHDDTVLPRSDSNLNPLTPEPSASGDRLEQANLRLAMLTEQLSRAEHQLVWLRATQAKNQSN